MTTESIEVYALEPDDQVLINGEVYRITFIDMIDRDTSRIHVVDAEGIRRMIDAEDSQKISVLVLDNAEAVV